MVKAELERGTPMLVFVIGGPDGLSDAVRESARGGILSLGRMTWPHRLARVMIAEQIYRAVTILINHPYHRG
jgi:23S rRNA (pseudouridine1915-N3)-methyltransferase